MNTHWAWAMRFRGKSSTLYILPVGDARMRSKSFVPVPGTAVVLISTLAVTGAAPGESAALYCTVIRLFTPPKVANEPLKLTLSAMPLWFPDRSFASSASGHVIVAGAASATAGQAATPASASSAVSTDFFMPRTTVNGFCRIRSSCRLCLPGPLALTNRSLTVSAELAQELARDHDALDLVRALVDLGDLRVAHHPLDWIFLDVAVAAEDLHGVGRHVHGGVGAGELAHRRELGQLGAVDPRVEHVRDAVEQPARALELRPHVGEHELDPLLLGDRLSERDPLGGVAERVVERRLANPERLRGDPRARAVEHAHGDPESLTLGTDQSVAGDPAAVHQELARRR